MQKEKLINRLLVIIGICVVIGAAWMMVFRKDDGGSQQFITYATAVPVYQPETEETPGPEIVPDDETQPEPEATSLSEAYPGFRSCTISAAGNITVTRELFEAFSGKKGYDFSPAFQDISPYIERSDITLATVVGPMGGEGTLGYADYPQFNTPETMIDAVKAAGIDLLALSNRHSLDTLFDGFKSQIDFLNQKKMAYFGGAASAEEHAEPVIRTAGDIRIGFLNYTDSLNGMEAYSEHAALEYGVNLLSESDVKADVKALHKAGAEVVVAYVIWGDEDSDHYNSQQKNTCKKLAEAGVDVIFGAGPQSVQPAFRVSGKGKTGSCVCVCSMGNFLTAADPEAENLAQFESGMLFTVTLQETDLGKIEVMEARYLPTYIWNDTASNTYRVLCAADALDVMPQGMTEEAYQRMNEAYQEVLFVMANGTGTNDVSVR